MKINHEFTGSIGVLVRHKTHKTLNITISSSSVQHYDIVVKHCCVDKRFTRIK